MHPFTKIRSVDRQINELNKLEQSLNKLPLTDNIDEMPVGQIMGIEEVKRLKNNINRDARLHGIKSPLNQTQFDTEVGIADSTVLENKPIPERMPASGLNVSDDLIDHLKIWETYVPVVTDDGFGNPTGGYGHVEGIGDAWYDGMAVPKSYADQLIRNDYREAERAIKRKLGNLPLKQNEFDALVDLAFNVGATDLNEENSPSLNKAIRESNYDEIGNNLVYRKSNGKIVRGLENRSDSRVNLFNNGQYGKR